MVGSVDWGRSPPQSCNGGVSKVTLRRYGSLVQGNMGRTDLIVFLMHITGIKAVP